MSAETDLLPLPEWQGDFMTESEFREEAQAYARACVSSATEALRAEVEKQSAYAKRTHDWNTEMLANNERLAEALRMFLQAGVGNSTDFYVQYYATIAARAALEQETTND